MPSSPPNPSGSSLRGRLRIFGLVGYLLFISVLLGLLFFARNRVLHHTDPQQATSQWQQWVEDVQQQSETAGPVKRRPPETAEPPALILMRDLFGVCLAATLVFGTVLFGSFWWLLSGALAAGNVPGHDRR